MYLTIKNIHQSFGSEIILEDLSFSLPHQKVLSILGQSGSGKTTLLKIIAGLTTPQQGQVLLDGVDISNKAANTRNIVYLYQEPLLFPHLNVFENVAFGLRLRKIETTQLQQQTTEMIERLGLIEHRNKMPNQLSGGQRQRVAFGRALIINPSVLLLDEPFGALDPSIRSQMQDLLQEMMQNFQITGLFVTHDIKEALLMGDQIGLMEKGQLTIFKDKQTFIQDPRTGVQKELNFWKNLHEGLH